MTQVSATKPSRLHEIDGIRGWAALSVVLFHLMWLIFGTVVPEIRAPYLRFLFDGPLAVCVFFVLSGDALSSPYMLSGDSSFIAKMALKRYFRLAFPTCLSCLVAYGLMRAGMMYNNQAAPIVDSADWLGSFVQFKPEFWAMIKYSFVTIFTNHTAAASYNPFLWPMSIELVGSFLVFTYLGIIRWLRRPVLLTAILFCISFSLNVFYSLFFAGVLFSLLRKYGGFDEIRNSYVGRWGAPTLLALCILGDCCLYKFNISDDKNWVKACLAISIVFAIYSNRFVCSFFTTSFSKFLGRISFPLYLLQFSILSSFTSYLIIRYNQTGSLNTETAFFISATTLLLVVMGSLCFEPVEKLLLGAIDKLIRAHMHKSTEIATST